MVWAKLDDEILDNPKIAAAGVFGFALHVAAITWCNRNLTDGFLPAARARSLLDFSRVNYDASNPLALVDGPRSMAGSEGLDAFTVGEHLVSVGLWRWDEERRGWWLKDFLVYNPSKEKVMAERARKSKRPSAPPSPRKAPGASAELPPETPRNPAGNSDGPVPVPVPDQDPLPPSVGAPMGGKPEERESKVRRKPETGCPPSDASRESVVAWCGTWNLPAEHPEFARFLDHHRARETRFRDWAAAWRTWLGKAEQFASERRLRPGALAVQQAIPGAWKVPEEMP